MPFWMPTHLPAQRGPAIVWPIENTLNAPSWRAKR